MAVEHAGPWRGGAHGGPLAGVRVLDFSEIIAAPFCTMMLSDMGADVIKVEPPDGEAWRLQTQFMPGESKGFMSLNRGKRGLAVDLKTAEGQAIIHALVREADVAVVNYRPDVPAKLGIDYATLAALNPRLIYAWNTAFGHQGPHAHRPGYDIILQAMTGLMSTAGGATAEGAPVTVGGTAVVDFSAGLILAWAISAALYARERTGEGQQIDTSLFGAGLAIQTTRFFAVKDVDLEPRGQLLETVRAHRRAGATYPETVQAVGTARGTPAAGSNLYYRCYQAGDGFVAIGCLSAALRLKFCRALGISDARLSPLGVMRRDPENVEQTRQLVQETEALFRTRSVAAWLAVFDAAGVPAGPVQFVDELFDDAHVHANGLLVEVEHVAAGALQMVGPPVQMSRTPLAPQGASPALGQHTDALLHALGYDAARIAALREQGIVR